MTSVRPTGVIGSTSLSIMSTSVSVSDFTARGVNRRLTSRRWCKCTGSSLAIMFDSPGDSLSRYDESDEKTSAWRSTHWMSACLVMHQIPDRSSRWTGSLARAHVHASCGLRCQKARSKTSITGLVVAMRAILTDRTKRSHSRGQGVNRVDIGRPHEHDDAVDAELGEAIAFTTVAAAGRGDDELARIATGLLVRRTSDVDEWRGAGRVDAVAETPRELGHLRTEAADDDRYWRVGSQEPAHSPDRAGP